MPNYTTEAYHMLSRLNPTLFQPNAEKMVIHVWAVSNRPQLVEHSTNITRMGIWNEHWENMKCFCRNLVPLPATKIVQNFVHRQMNNRSQDWTEAIEISSSTTKLISIQERRLHCSAAPCVATCGLSSTECLAIKADWSSLPSKVQV